MRFLALLVSIANTMVFCNGLKDKFCERWTLPRRACDQFHSPRSEVSLAQFSAWNPLKAVDCPFLFGEIVCKQPRPDAKLPDPVLPENCQKVHVVAGENENCNSAADKYNIAMDDLMDWNDSFYYKVAPQEDLVIGSKFCVSVNW
jgi:hypothetical protein